MDCAQRVSEGARVHKGASRGGGGRADPGMASQGAARIPWGLNRLWSPPHCVASVSTRTRNGRLVLSVPTGGVIFWIAAMGRSCARAWLRAWLSLCSSAHRIPQVRSLDADMGAVTLCRSRSTTATRPRQKWRGKSPFFLALQLAFSFRVAVHDSIQMRGFQALTHHGRRSHVPVCRGLPGPVGGACDQQLPCQRFWHFGVCPFVCSLGLGLSSKHRSAVQHAQFACRHRFPAWGAGQLHRNFAN